MKYILGLVAVYIFIVAATIVVTFTLEQMGGTLFEMNFTKIQHEIEDIEKRLLVLDHHQHSSIGSKIWERKVDPTLQ